MTVSGEPAEAHGGEARRRVGEFFFRLATMFIFLHTMKRQRIARKERENDESGTNTRGK